MISLTDIPAMNAKPPGIPLFRLCLITEKIIGPTEIASNSPSVTPFIIASSIVQSKKYWVRGARYETDH